MTKHIRVPKETRQFVIERETNAHGQLICAHCTDAITDKQIVTMQHKVQRNRYDDKFTRVCRDLGVPEDEIARMKDAPPKERQAFVIQHLNDPTNLEPMHVSCHSEVDNGRPVDPEKAHYLNLKPEYREDYAPTRDGNALAEYIIDLPPSIEAVNERIEAADRPTLEVCEGAIRGKIVEMELSTIAGKDRATVTTIRWLEAMHDMLMETIDQHHGQGR